MHQIERKLKIILITIIAFVLLLGAFILIHYKPFTPLDHNQAPSDFCTQKDISDNNCVQPGHCLPPGNPLEGQVDCALKNYPHKEYLNK